MSGSLLLNFEPYKNALGVKPQGVQWSPSSQLLAIGGFDQKARILNSLTWKPIGEYHHPVNVVPDDYPNCIVFRELEYRSTSESHQKTRYELEDLPVQLKPLKVTNYKKANPKIGVGMLGWSADSQYLFTRNDNMPNVLWIWETRKLSLIAMLIQLEPIKAAVWHPKLPYLALCTGNSKIYTWHVHSTSCVDIPVVTFKVQNIKWNSTGDALMLMDEAAFCLCYISDMGQSEEQLQ
jgi:WD40 repeat protein